LKILGIYFTYDEKLRNKLNFDDILTSIKETLNKWKWRNLTLYGRIQIIKSFAIPKLIYRASQISIDKATIGNASRLLFDFLWNGRDRVKRTVMISDLDEGGLKMPHIDSIIKAQRIMCSIKFITNYNSTWKWFLEQYLCSVGGSFLLNCCFDIKHLNIGLPKYYHECLETWSSLLATSKPETHIEILNEVIWNNKNICIANRSIYNNKLFNMGIVKIGNILDQCGKLKSFEIFKQDLLGITLADYFLLIGIVQSLPPDWKIILKKNIPLSKRINSDVVIQIQLNKKRIKTHKITSKLLYSEFVTQSISSPTAVRKYETIYSNTNFNWKKIFTLPVKISLDTKSREFQFKILHRILYTNYLGFKMKITSSNLCTFCENTEESLEHLFVSCKHTRFYWIKIKNWLNSLGYNVASFSEIDILFGQWDNESNNSITIIFLILTAKQVIYKCRSLKIKPSLDILIVKLKQIKQIEYFIARRRDKMLDYQKKRDIINV